MPEGTEIAQATGQTAQATGQSGASQGAAGSGGSPAGTETVETLQKRLQAVETEKAELLRETMGRKDKIKGLEAQITELQGIKTRLDQLESEKNQQSAEAQAKEMELLKKKGDFEAYEGKLKRLHDDELQRIRDSHTSEKKKLEEENAAIKRQQEELADAQAVMAMQRSLMETGSKLGAKNPDWLPKLIGGSIGFDTETGKVVVLDNDGTPRLATDGRQMTVEEYVSGFLKENPHLVRAATPGGSGQGSPGTGGLETTGVVTGLTKEQLTDPDFMAKGGIQTLRNLLDKQAQTNR